MRKLTDEQIDIAISLILRTGVIASAMLVAAGGIGYLTGHGNTPPTASLSSIREILRGALRWQPLFIIQLGLLVLMATPVVRVVACAVGFGLEGDSKYVVISLLVLGLLLISLL